MSSAIHEFSHPYCNPLIFANWTTISEKSEEIFKTVSTLLSSQAYSEAQTMICETLVRASSTIYMKTHNQGNKVESELIRQENTGFPLVRPIYNMIVERGAGENVILADLMPEIIKIINEFDYEKEEPTPETEKDNTATEFPTNHDYVDLDIKFSDGRKLYFATMNVGETTIGGTGSYSYCWGATEPFGPAWVNNEGIEVWPKGHTLDSDHDLCTVMWGGD